MAHASFLVFAALIPSHGRFPLSAMKTILTLTIPCFLTLGTFTHAAPTAQEILDATGVTGGLVIHLDANDGKLTHGLRASDAYCVQGWDRDAAQVDAARKWVQSQGDYGAVSFDRLMGGELPYTDNLANLVVAEDLEGVAMEEVMRVLAPRGVAYVKRGDEWVKTVKERPSEIDDWTHYLHSASGNAVAQDAIAGPPRHLQWIGGPRWSRHHDRMASMSALVSAGGRMIYIMDEGSRISIQMPPRWRVIARDAFNGTILWKRDIDHWQSHLWPLKSGPTQLARRLVATADTVFVTLGLEAPLVALDAVTGETLRAYEGSISTEEVIHSNGSLFLLTNEHMHELREFAPKLNTGDQQRVDKEYHWNNKLRHVMAYEAATGRQLWDHETTISPLTLSANDTHVFYHDGEKVICLDREDGKVAWESSQTNQRSAFAFNFGPRLVIHDQVVLYAGGDRTMKAFDVATGKDLWQSEHDQSGYKSPEDLLVAGGLVWSAPLTRTKDSGVFTGRDPITGEVKSQFAPEVETYWFHHRCYLTKATERFLMPSRTGIEFVDFREEDWDINHWVRGGCLYGVMPCNGMVYAPPHNCACYPETKLYGLNALAPALSKKPFQEASPDERLEKGPAFAAVEDERVSTTDWPTFRYNNERTGYTPAAMKPALDLAWEKPLGGKLSAMVVANGRAYVARIDEHTVLALDAESGDELWSYTTGGRVDSPPTIDRGRVFFGSADGWVYCLRASDGSLVWRFLAAPEDRRLTAFQQVESIWPVHGTVLVQNGAVTFVAGRSSFLDSGLRMYQLEAETGKMLSVKRIDEKDPETGENMQKHIQILNMPVGLPDILSSSGNYIYMRSQRFDLEGNRQELGPHSGDPATQGSAQHGEGVHVFAPMGFLDGSWFHRAYWVYGKSYAGGHSGYHQAGKFTPSGRLLVFDEENVYGFGRKPEYYKWTTTLEHQLFSTSKVAPQVPAQARRRGVKGSMVQLAKAAGLDPAKKALAIEAWIKPSRVNGVILAHGGPAQGYALHLRNGRLQFDVRSGEKLTSITSNRRVKNEWVHVVGRLAASGEMDLFMNGEMASQTGKTPLVASDPAQGIEIGADAVSSVGDYPTPSHFNGVIDEVRLYHGDLTSDAIAARFADPASKPSGATLVFASSFDNGKAQDASGKGHHGSVVAAKMTEGRVGDGIAFSGPAGNKSRRTNSLIKHHWRTDVPLLVRAMVLADKTLFIAGPPDLIDEEATFQRLTERDETVHAELAKQQAALDGEQGGLLQVRSATNGEKLAEYPLDALPIWDGMALADGRLYLATKSGTVMCFKES